VTLKELVLDHLTYTFEREAWQPPLAAAIDGLTAQHAAWKPAPERHSIWQIVRHVILWKEALLDSWDGRVPDYRLLEDADWVDAAGDDAAWQRDVQRLHEVSRRIKERIQSDADVSRLLPTVQGYPDQPMAVRAVRAATHDIYHSGQIRYIRALQGV
jgi:hypothetical protein